MTVYGGPPSEPSVWPDEPDRRSPSDQPSAPDGGYGPPPAEPQTSFSAFGPPTAGTGPRGGAFRPATGSASVYGSTPPPPPPYGVPAPPYGAPAPDSGSADPGPAFSGRAEPTGSVFGGRAEPPGPAFGGRAESTGPAFSGRAEPPGPAFSGRAEPTGSMFNGRAEPPGPAFSGRAEPTGSMFGGPAEPPGAAFGGRAESTGPVFGGPAEPTGGMFGARADQSGPVFGGRAEPTGPVFSGWAEPPAAGFGAAQGGGPAYGAASGPSTGPMYGASRAPDPGATRGPDDLYSAEAYRPEERAGRRKLPLPGDPPVARSGGGRRTAIILGVLAVLIVGAGTAGAATFLSGDDPAPASSNQPPAAAKQTGAASPDGSPAGAAVPGPAEGISMSATGDIVMGMAPNGLPPNGGKGFFDPVKSFLAADFQMGNLEQVLTDDTGVGKCSAEAAGKTCFAFRTPPSYANNLKDAGFHMMNMANNHANDFGDQGYKNSQKALDAVGIKYTGAPGMISVGEAKGVKIAVVGFASYKWSNLCSDLDAAEKIIKEAAAQANLVVVQVHQGAEGSDKTQTKPGTEYFLGENRCDTIAFAHRVIDAGADLVVGHGPHVMRAMEFYKGRLIAYSLGNFAGYKALSFNGVVGIGGVLKVTLAGDGTWKSGSLTATYMVTPGLPKPDPKKQAIPFVSNLTKQDFPTTGAKIGTDGTIAPPPSG